MSRSPFDSAMRASLRSFVLPILLSASSASIVAEGLEFEVASVRGPTHPSVGTTKGGPGTSDPEHISFTHVSMGRLIAIAFRKNPDEVVAPDWAYDRNRETVPVYDIEAKVSPGATQEQLSEMMRNLMTGRFHLAYHFVRKDFDGYEILVGKGGSKLSPATPTVGTPALGPDPEGRDRDGYPVLPPGHPSFRSSGLDGRLKTTVRSEPVSVLERLLQAPLSLPGNVVHIVDHSGLTGLYDFKFEYEVIHTEQGFDDQRESILTGLASLGLTLKQTKIPVDVLVIDHLDQTPTEN